MSRDPILFLEDILEAIGQIQQFIEGMDQDEFMRDQKTIHAYMSCFQIVGEATKKLPVTWKEEQPSIPWQQIQGFRNALAHEYFHIDERIMWNTIQEDLGSLLAACEHIQKRVAKENT